MKQVDLNILSSMINISMGRWDCYPDGLTPPLWDNLGEIMRDQIQHLIRKQQNDL